MLGQTPGVFLSCLTPLLLPPQVCFTAYLSENPFYSNITNRTVKALVCLLPHVHAVSKQLVLFGKDGRLNKLLKCYFSLCHNCSKCAEERPDSLTWPLLSFLFILAETFELHVNTLHHECLFHWHMKDSGGKQDSGGSRRCMFGPIYIAIFSRSETEFPCAAFPDCLLSLSRVSVWHDCK